MKATEVPYTFEEKKYIVTLQSTNSSIIILLTDIYDLNKIFIKNIKNKLLEEHPPANIAVIDTSVLSKSSTSVFKCLRDEKLKEITGLSAGFYKKIIGLSKLGRILLFISMKIEKGKKIILLKNTFQNLEAKEIEKLLFVLDELTELYSIQFIIGSDGTFQNKETDDQSDIQNESTPFQSNSVSDMSKKKIEIIEKVDFFLIKDHKLDKLPFDFQFALLNKEPTKKIIKGNMQIWMYKRYRFFLHIILFFLIAFIIKQFTFIDFDPVKERKRAFFSFWFLSFAILPLFSAVFADIKNQTYNIPIIICEFFLFFLISWELSWKLLFSIIYSHEIARMNKYFLLSYAMFLIVPFIDSTLIHTLLPISPMLYFLKFINTLIIPICWILFISLACFYYKRCY